MNTGIGIGRESADDPTTVVVIVECFTILPFYTRKYNTERVPRRADTNDRYTPRIRRFSKFLRAFFSFFLKNNPLGLCATIKRYCKRYENWKKNIYIYYSNFFSSSPHRFETVVLIIFQKNFYCTKALFSFFLLSRICIFPKINRLRSHERTQPRGRHSIKNFGKKKNSGKPTDKREKVLVLKNCKTYRFFSPDCAKEQKNK